MDYGVLVLLTTLFTFQIVESFYSFDVTMVASYNSGPIPAKTNAHSDFDTKEILLIIYRLENSQINDFLRFSSAESLTEKFSSVLPFTIKNVFDEKSNQFESLRRYVSKIYENIDITAVIAALFHRGFVSTNDIEKNTWKLAIVLIILFKLKEMYISPTNSSIESLSTVQSEEWAS